MHHYRYTVSITAGSPVAKTQHKIIDFFVSFASHTLGKWLTKPLRKSVTFSQN